MRRLRGSRIGGLTAAMIVAAFIAAAAAALMLVPNQPTELAGNPLFSATSNIPNLVLTGQACRNCHAEVCDSHAAAPHGRTLTRLNTEAARQILDGRRWVRPDTGVTYEYRDSGGQLLLSSSATARSRAITWLVGSGRHARTPLLTSLDADGRTTAIEHSVSLYPDGSLATTLEMEAITDSIGLPALGNFRSCSETANCFGCHSTSVPVQSGLILEDRIVPGVGCIRCHQDGAKHAAAMGRGDEFAGERPALLSPRESVDRCGECHRRSDELGGQLHPDNPTLARFASVGLVQSRCFINQPHGADTPGDADRATTTGRLDCISCHSPHAQSDSRWQSFTAICLNCHGIASGKSSFDCPKSAPAENCLDCHMKKVPFGDRLKFTDHWIR